ncbi:MAG: APC family permease, partial [Planctomycetes bacterium]|nr:APC family permease [Planctomycetota bacterium]
MRCISFARTISARRSAIRGCGRLPGFMPTSARETLMGISAPLTRRIVAANRIARFTPVTSIQRRSSLLCTRARTPAPGMMAHRNSARMIRVETAERLMIKSMAQPTSEVGSVQLARNLSLFDITMVGVGAMIGAGIFVLTGIAAGPAGPALILAFALNGIVTFITAMVYAELGSAIPEAGGGYLWIKQGLPAWNGFLAGWMSWFAHAVAGSLYALGFGAYSAAVLHGFGLVPAAIPEAHLAKALAVIVALVFIGINFKGVSETGKVGNVITLAKILILAIFVVSGMAAIMRHPSYMAKFTPFATGGITGVLTAMGLTFIAFEGYEIIVQAGEEVKNPKRNIPRAIFLSLAIVVPIYMLVAFTAIGAVEPGTDQPTWQWLAEHAELGLA